MPLCRLLPQTRAYPTKCWKSGWTSRTAIRQIDALDQRIELLEAEADLADRILDVQAERQAARDAITAADEGTGLRLCERSGTPPLGPAESKSSPRIIPTSNARNARLRRASPSKTAQQHGRRE